MLGSGLQPTPTPGQSPPAPRALGPPVPPKAVAAPPSLALGPACSGVLLDPSSLSFTSTQTSVLSGPRGLFPGPCPWAAMTSFRSLTCIPEPATHPSRPGCHQPRSPSMPHMATRASEHHVLLCEVLTASAGLGSLAPAAVPLGALPAQALGPGHPTLRVLLPSCLRPTWPVLVSAGGAWPCWAYTFQHQETLRAELSCPFWSTCLHMGSSCCSRLQP